MVLPALLILAPQTPSARVDVYVRAPGEIRQWNFSPKGLKLRAKFAVPKTKVGSWFVVSPSGRFLGWDDPESAKFIVLDRMNPSKLVRLPQTRASRVFLSDRWLVLTGPITAKHLANDRPPLSVWAYSLPTFREREFQLRAYVGGLINDRLFVYDASLPGYTIPLSLTETMKPWKRLPLADKWKSTVVSAGAGSEYSPLDATQSLEDARARLQKTHQLIFSSDSRALFVPNLFVEVPVGIVWAHEMFYVYDTYSGGITLFNSDKKLPFNPVWSPGAKILWTLTNEAIRTGWEPFLKEREGRLFLYGFDRTGRMPARYNINIPGFRAGYHVAMTVQ